MATDVGNPLFGGGGDQDDDNFFGNAVKKQAVVDDVNLQRLLSTRTA
jgi:hypothetical protein